MKSLIPKTRSNYHRPTKKHQDKSKYNRKKSKLKLKQYLNEFYSRSN